MTGFVESSLCRFCKRVPEAMPHWIFECSALPLSQPPQHELGDNFSMLGLCEHPVGSPVGICKHRMHFTSIANDTPSAFDPSRNRTPFWTDGSVFLTESFWLTTAGCSIVNEHGQCILAERVCFPALSSYTAELFAVYRLIFLSTTCIDVYTDSENYRSTIWTTYFGPTG